MIFGSCTARIVAWLSLLGRRVGLVGLVGRRRRRRVLAFHRHLDDGRRGAREVLVRVRREVLKHTKAGVSLVYPCPPGGSAAVRLHVAGEASEARYIGGPQAKGRVQVRLQRTARQQYIN